MLSVQKYRYVFHNISPLIAHSQYDAGFAENYFDGRKAAKTILDWQQSHKYPILF